MEFSQNAFNITMGLAAFLAGWVLNNLRESIVALHKADEGLTSKVQSMEVLVAGYYVRREDIDKLITALFIKLDKIEVKLDGKADKP